MTELFWAVEEPSKKLESTSALNWPVALEDVGMEVLGEQPPLVLPTLVVWNKPEVKIPSSSVANGEET